MLQEDPVWLGACAIIVMLALLVKLFRVIKAGRRYIASEHAKRVIELRGRGA